MAPIAAAVVPADAPSGADDHVRSMLPATAGGWPTTSAWLTRSVAVGVLGRDGTCTGGALVVDDRTGVVAALDGLLVARRDLAASLGERAASPLDDVNLALRAYLEWGEGFAARVLGEFAIVIWDPRTSTLVCARDPSGMRMLVHAHDGRGTRLVATMPREILRGASVPTSVDLLGFADLLLTRSAILPERSPCASVRRIPPGSTLVARGDVGLIREHASYARIAADVSDVGAPDLERLAGTIEESLVDRVGRVPGGLLLSGGWDSGALLETWMHAERLGPDVGRPVTFTHHPLGAGDERAAVRQRVERFGLDARFVQLPMDGGIFDGLAEHAELIGLPEITPTWQAHRAIARDARGLGIWRLAAGDGGDISLTSAYSKVAALLFRRGPVSAVRQLGIFARGSNSDMWQQLRATVGAIVPMVAPAAWDVARRLRPGSAADRLGLDFLTPVARGAADEVTAAAVEVYRRSAGHAPLVAREIGIGLDRVARLASSDHPAFAVEGVHVTAPFQDARVVRAAMAAACSDLDPSGWRSLMARAMRTHTRQPFVGNLVEMSGWFASAIRAADGVPDRRAALDPVALSDAGVVDPRRFRRVVDRTVAASGAGDPRAVRAIWHVASVEAWARRWL